MSTNLNAKAYKDDIRRNCVLLILLQQFGQDPFLFYHDNASVYKTRFKKKMIDSVSVEELDWSAENQVLIPV